MNRILAVLMLCLATVCYADLTVVQKVTTGEMMGRPAGDTIVKMMVKGKRARIETEGETGYQILDLEENTMFLVDPDARRAMTMSLETMKAAEGLVGGMMKNSSTSVKKTGNRKKINGYNCEEYSVVISGGMLNMNSKQWITNEIDTSEMEGFQAFTQGMMKMLGSDDLAQIKGLPVRTESNVEMAGQKMQSTSEVVTVSREPLSDGLFLIPPGYEVNTMESVLKE